MDTTCGFIGVGNMGYALLKGLLHAKKFLPDSVSIYDIDSAKGRDIAQREGVVCLQGPSDIVARAKIVVLAVKPKDVSSLLNDIKDAVTSDTLLISIAAGITLSQLESAFSSPVKVIRVMPNTPALVREGMSALAAGKHVFAEDLDIASEMFRCVGETVVVAEQYMDAVTALSGSGPAYVFYLAEAMIAAGIKMGLTQDVARRLTLQTIVGAADLAYQSPVSPEELRKKVTSPGGTTERAVSIFDDAGLKQVVIDAILAAQARSKELSK